MSGARVPLPPWVDIGLIPLANVVLAFFAAGLIVLAIGENPLLALRFMLAGALGDSEGIGYTLYYATNFIFTGLAVALAFHAGLFNIGGEGQAYIGGLGIGLVLLAGDRYLPFPVLLPLALLAGAGFGAAWALLPAYLQAYRGSHIVITTIMFNFLAAALMVYLMVNLLIAPGSMSPESREFGPAAGLPFLHDLLAGVGIKLTATPLNLSFVLALALSVFVWLLLWHTAFGFELRTVGQSEKAAVYAGVRPRRIIIIAMCLSGAIAGFVGLNEIMGVHHRLLLNFTAGYGFTGIAVALMDANHPFGIVLASILFGILSQGGTELAFDIPTITRDMIVVIQGLVILFSGALSELSRPWFERLFGALLARRRLCEVPDVADGLTIVVLTLSATLRVATPLVFCAMAGLLSERAGIIDISLEGKMLASAFAAAAVAALSGSAWYALGAGILIACALALLHGYACITQKGNQVVSGIALNILASGLTIVLGNAWFHRGGQTPNLSAAARFMPIEFPAAAELRDLPVLGPIYHALISGHNLLVYAAFLTVPLTHWAVGRTRFGLRLRAVGENPQAVDTAGISVAWLRYRAVLLGGLLTGAAGTYLAIAQNAGFSRDMTAGQGYIALAAMIFGKWRPYQALGACLMFGLLDAIAIRLQGVHVAGIGEVPVQLIQALPYALTVILLAGFVGKAVAPKAVGIAYVKER